MKLKTTLILFLFSLLLFPSLHATGMEGGSSAPAVVAEHVASEFLLVEQQGQGAVTCASGSLVAMSTPLNNARLFVFERGFSLVYYGVASAPLTRSRELYRGQTARTLSSYRVDFTFDDYTAGKTRLTHPHGTRRHRYDAGNPAGAENLQHYSGVTFEELYPGIDLHCRLDEGGIKYEFHLRPGADPSRIALRIDGAGAPRQRNDGGLSYTHVAGTLRDNAPLVYQTTEDGVREVLSSDWHYRNGSLGFDVRDADPARAVIIDPYLQWSTFLGGSLSDYARDVVIDKAGTMFVCGYSASPDFPVTPGAIQSNPGGSFDIFISAFSRARRLLWSTYFGGSGSEENPRIAQAPDGSLYVAGSTSSTDLLVTQDAAQPRNAGRYDTFLLALDKQGRRRWATYFGGSYSDECGGIAVASDGTLFITGGTYSTNFPVTADALQTSNNGDYDIYLARFSPKGKRMWATYIGGWSMDIATAIAIGKNGDIILGGRTESTNFPGLNLDRQSLYGGGSFDAFVMRVDPETPAIRWSTYHGGEQEESIESIALDSKGNIILAGYTASERFPLAGNPVQKRFGGLIDVFVSSMNADGLLRWSTFLGGVEVDKTGGLAVDRQDNILISGFTGSRNFPMAGSPFYDRKGGGYDIFIAQFSAGGGYLWGTFYGGESHDISYGLGMDAQGNVVVVGGTESSGFRTVGNMFQGDLSGLTDAFLLRIIFDEPVAFAGQDTTICRGGNARLGGEASGGTPPYSYEWYPPGTVSNARVARPMASPLTTTSYRLTVTDAEGAVTSDTVVVTVTTPPVAGAGPDRAVCPGSSVVLQARAEKGQGPYSFL
ncbi:MAG: hypothetical protein KFH87_09365, partial [Bacteroidetes bacterium]|nr:hypothetical protein [Bacteroidota bacterium]